MPIYEYICAACKDKFERIQSFSDQPLATCEKCGGKLQKLMSECAVHFKGSGWYVTDYAKSGAARKESKSSEDHAKSEASKSSEDHAKSGATRAESKSSAGDGKSGASKSSAGDGKSGATRAESKSSEGDAKSTPSAPAVEKK